MFITELSIRLSQDFRDHLTNRMRINYKRIVRIASDIFKLATSKKYYY